MSWSLTRIVDPTEQPVTLLEAKDHLRVDGTDDDALISAQVAAATRWVEEYTGRQLVDATWKLTLDEWPDGDQILLPRPPLKTVASIDYTDRNGNVATMPTTDYLVDSSDDYGPGRIVLADGKSWPSTQLRRAAAVAITYTAGYGTAADVPDVYKTAIKTVVGSLYEHRETVVVGQTANLVPRSAEWLLWPHRVWMPT